MKLTPDKLKDLKDDLEDLFRCHQDVIQAEPRIEKPLTEAKDVAKRRYEEVAEGRPLSGARHPLQP